MTLGWGGEDPCRGGPGGLVRAAPNVGMVITGTALFRVACVAGWIM